MNRRFNVTTEKMAEWFKEFNEEYFEGVLPMPQFKIKVARYLGEYFPKYKSRKMTIILSNRLDRTEWEFQNTFIHEMIHEWQEVTNQEDKGHGEDFKRKAKEINEIGGWKIKRCSDTNGARELAKVKSRVPKNRVATLIRYKYLGSEMISKVTNSSLPYAIEYMLNGKGKGYYKDITTYKIKANCETDRLTQSTTRLHRNSLAYMSNLKALLDGKYKKIGEKVA